MHRNVHPFERLTIYAQAKPPECTVRRRNSAHYERTDRPKLGFFLMSNENTSTFKISDDASMLLLM